MHMPYFSEKCELADFAVGRQPAVANLNYWHVCTKRTPPQKKKTQKTQKTQNNPKKLDPKTKWFVFREKKHYILETYRLWTALQKEIGL
jgi:hypothetical protein